MPNNETSGSMVSRAIPEIPKDPKQMRRFLKKILTQHYKDIKNLYATCTDTDAFEKRQRDNAAL